MEINKSQIVNNKYAPGIATYGIDGKKGERGETGSSIYFTTYNLEYNRDVENEIKDVLVKINQNKILSGYTNDFLNRKYNIGDIIIDSCGYMYKLIERNGSFDLQYISQLRLDDSENFFQRFEDRIVLTENGLDIFDTFVSENIRIDGNKYPLRIISTNTNDENGRNELLSFQCQSYNDSNRFLNIYYDENTDSFHMETDSNIVFDTECLSVHETSGGESFDDYYKIEPYKDNIGMIHRLYSKSTYTVENGTIKINNLETGKYSNIDVKPDFLKVVFYKDGLKESEHLLVFDKTKEDISFDISLKLEDRIQSRPQDVIVSLVKGIEILIKEKQS